MKIGTYQWIRSSPIISHLKLRALNMKMGTLIVLFIFGELRCRNGLIIKVLMIPYFSLLVANFQNWLSVLFLDERLFPSLFTFPSMVIKNHLYFRDLYRLYEITFLLEENNIFLFSLNQRSLQRHLNKSNPTNQNLVEVSITYSKWCQGLDLVGRTKVRSPASPLGGV